jgi:hypothetical protein
MLALPIATIVDLNVEDGLPETATVQDGHRQPVGSLRAFHLISIAPPVLVKVDVVQMHKDIGSLHLIKISEPREVSGLQDDQGCHGQNL